jgi:hypothetical protein
MNPLDSQVLESFVPSYAAIPDKWEDARPFVVEQLKRHANAINVREIGFFLDEELLSGKSFIPGINNALDGETSQQFRTILRKVVDCGALPNAGLKSVPHGIFIDANFTLIDLFGAATDPIALLSFDLGHAAAPPNQVEIYLDAINVNIVTGTNRSTYTRSFITIEYIQEL